MGIFKTYDLLPQSYKTLPSNGTFCMYWVCETQNLKIFTVSITDYLQNAYVYQLSGMSNPQKYQCDSMGLQEFFHHSAVVSCITFHI